MVFGTQFFGKVDSVGNDLHVATRFHHFMFLPLVYQGTFLVLGNGTYCLPISISWYSIFLAYVRYTLAAVLIGALLTVVAMVLTDWPPSHSDQGFFVACVAAFIGSLIGLIASYQLTTANTKRRRELRALADRTPAEQLIHIGPVSIGMS